MNGLKIAIAVVQLIVAVIVVIAVVMQKSKQSGMSGAIGGGQDTYFGKNGSSSKDALLVKATKIGGIVFIALTLVLDILEVLYA